ncbi:nuclear transport factor 2 family protein [Roseomonas sp. BN140053]|uniref:nuclear transport factor 2 family protein n=1 Tax=Roseomonas sp. BN140053 TaxID=3391898 RepID=UPI0039EBACE3
MSDALTEAERFAVEWACTRLIHRFALLNDAGDYAAVAALFTEDGSFARPAAPDSPVQGRDAILRFFRDRPARVTRHLMNNVVVTAEAPDRASASSYVTLFTAPGGSTLPAKADPGIAIGRYDDQLVREDAEWRFVCRRGSMSLNF